MTKPSRETEDEWDGERVSGGGWKGNPGEKGRAQREYFAQRLRER